MTHLIEMFHDGGCPLCNREVALFRRLDRQRGRIRFTDIAAPDFDASRYGMTQAEFMARIKARRADGEWLDGVEVFRQLYTAVGFGPLVQATRVPGLSHALELAYDAFARNRLRLTGRHDACSTTSCTVQPG